MWLYRFMSYESRSGLPSLAIEVSRSRLWPTAVWLAAWNSEELSWTAYLNDSVVPFTTVHSVPVGFQTLFFVSVIWSEFRMVIMASKRASKSNEFTILPIYLNKINAFITFLEVDSSLVWLQVVLDKISANSWWILLQNGSFCHFSCLFAYMYVYTEGSVTLATGLGWLWIVLFHPLPRSAWADGKLAEVAEQVGKRGNIPNQSQPNPVANLTPPSVWSIITYMRDKRGPYILNWVYS